MKEIIGGILECHKTKRIKYISLKKINECSKTASEEMYQMFDTHAKFYETILIKIVVYSMWVIINFKIFKNRISLKFNQSNENSQSERK